MRSKIKLSVTALGQALFAYALLGQSGIAAEKTDGLTGEQIIERTHEASKRTGQGDEVFKFTARRRSTNLMPRAMSSRKTAKLIAPTPMIVIKNCARSTAARRRNANGIVSTKNIRSVSGDT